MPPKKEKAKSGFLSVTDNTAGAVTVHTDGNSEDEYSSSEDEYDNDDQKGTVNQIRLGIKTTSFDLNAKSVSAPELLYHDRISSSDASELVDRNSHLANFRHFRPIAQDVVGSRLLNEYRDVTSAVFDESDQQSVVTPEKFLLDGKPFAHAVFPHSPPGLDQLVRVTLQFDAVFPRSKWNDECTPDSSVVVKIPPENLAVFVDKSSVSADSPAILLPKFHWLVKKITLSHYAITGIDPDSLPYLGVALVSAIPSKKSTHKKQSNPFEPSRLQNNTVIWTSSVPCSNMKAPSPENGLFATKLGIGRFQHNHTVNEVMYTCEPWLTPPEEWMAVCRYGPCDLSDIAPKQRFPDIDDEPGSFYVDVPPAPSYKTTSIAQYLALTNYDSVKPEKTPSYIERNKSSPYVGKLKVQRHKLGLLATRLQRNIGIEKYCMSLTNGVALYLTPGPTHSDFGIARSTETTKASNDQNKPVTITVTVCLDVVPMEYFSSKRS